VLLVSSYPVETWVPISAYYHYKVILDKAIHGMEYVEFMHDLVILGSNKFLFQEYMLIQEG
jgi:hypothetical protein